MATVTRVNGAVASFQAFGRAIRFLTVSQSDATALELEAIVNALTVKGLTVEAIGAFTAGVSDTVNIIVSGNEAISTADLSTAAGAAVAGTTVADMAF
jgi:hypothetical protein